MSCSESWKHAISLLCGVSLATAYPGYGYWPLAWVALAPFLFIVLTNNPAKGFFLGLLMGIGMFGPTFTWLSNSMIDYGNISQMLAFAINFLGIVYIAFFVGIFAYTICWIANRLSREMALASAPFIWVGIEQLRTWLPPFAFPWARIADSQSQVLQVIQFVDITGEEGLCFLIVFTNASLASILFWISGERQKSKFPAKWVALTIGMILAALVYGSARIEQIKTKEGRDINVALVQGNIDQRKKWNRKYLQKQFFIYEQRTIKAAIDGAKLIIWPETAIPFYFGRDPTFDNRMFSLAKTTGANILFGGLSIIDGEKSPEIFNSAWTLTSEGELAKYDKVHLVPFGEYVPLKSLLFFVNSMASTIGNLQAGKIIKPIKVDDIMVAPQICFEVIFPRYSRIMSSAGADIIVNITNDSWFGDSAASAQSMAMAVFRAVENRKPLLRSAQSGISAIIDSTGKITGQSGLFVETTLIGKVKINQKINSLYTSSNGLFGWVMLVSLFGFLCLALSKGKSKVG
ncbi:MAG TPA: apolipoprotein N-acyltransferase [Nitrospinota bacterium]|nr:apolipoprotein N-acyltransferase [Nitrospinota bacterium]